MTYKCLSIFLGKGRVSHKRNYKNGVPPYGKQIVKGKTSSSCSVLTMSWIIFFIVFGTFATIVPNVVAEMDYFPGELFIKGNFFSRTIVCVCVCVCFYVNTSLNDMSYFYMSIKFCMCTVYSCVGRQE